MIALSEVWDYSKFPHQLFLTTGSDMLTISPNCGVEIGNCFLRKLMNLLEVMNLFARVSFDRVNIRLLLLFSPRLSGF